MNSRIRNSDIRIDISRRLFIFTFLILTFSCSLNLADENKGDEGDKGDSKGNGFGEDYNWVKYDEAFSTAKDLNKPVMFLIHKTWCGACKALKPQFSKSKSILELSDQFVMVNTVDDEEPSGDKYTPDGGYIPRILFFDSNGELLENIINESGLPDYKYYYNQDEAIVDSMKRTLSFVAGKESGTGTGDDEADVDEAANDDSNDNDNRIEL